MLGWMAGALALALILLNLASLAIADFRWRGRQRSNAQVRPPVSIIRPLRGLEEFSRETLDANFAIDWPNYEILFCVQNAADPIIPLVRDAIARHPDAAARLLIGEDAVTANPKLNNCLKGWRAARHDWIALADSNALLPPDYLARMMAAWRDDTGLVVSMPLGTRATTFAAQIEAAFLNTFQARWQYAAEAVGQGFAQGKNMLWRKDTVERAGGLAVLGAQPAEDAAATRLVRSQRLKVHLVNVPFEQPLGRRRLRDVWLRQTRWARLRRATFPLQFLPEILTGAVAPVVLAGLCAWLLGFGAVAPAVIAALVLYGAELILAMRAGLWTGGWRLPVAILVRDLCIPFIYLDAWLIDSFTWHGHDMNVKHDEALLRQTAT